MTEQSAYPCPVCHTLTTLEHPCPGCGRAPDPNAAAVITLDGEILRLRTQADEAQRQLDEAKRRFDELNWKLAETRRQREAYATAVRAAVARETGARQAQETPTTATAATATAATATAAPTVPVGDAAKAPRAEASTGTIQNLLFILGGLLLGVAAIVFTAVAWARFGVTGRAAILSLVTLVTLAVPPLVRGRGLRGTAETFAALGLLLLVLDGYAAWFVNLGGIQERWDGSFYAGTVAAVTSLAGYAYGRFFELAGPRFIALAAAQPVLPLFVIGASPGREVWALVFAAVALADLAFLHRYRRPLALAVTTGVFHGTALLISFVITLFVWAQEGTVLSSLALLGVVAVFAAGAWVSGAHAHRFAAGGAGAFVLAAAIARPVLPDLPAARQLLTGSAIAALVALLAWVASLRRAVEVAPPPEPVATEPADERLPALWSTFDPAAVPAEPEPAPPPAANPWTTGARWGAGLAVAVPALITLGWALFLGATALADALPWWHATTPEQRLVWELPVAVAILAGAATLLATAGRGTRAGSEGGLRELILTLGPVTLALVLPYPWIAGLLVAAGLLAWAWLTPELRVARCVAALALSVYAILSAQGEPERATIVMTAAAVLGLTVAAVAPKRGRRAVGGVAAGLVDLLLPWLGFTAVAAFSGGIVASWRVLLVLVVLVPVLGSARSYRGYHVVAGLIIALYPLWPDLPGGESQALYAAAGAVAATIVVSGCSWQWARAVSVVPAVATLGWTATRWAAVLWPSEAETPAVDPLDAVAITLLLAPVISLTWKLGRRNALTIGGFALVLPVLMWLAVLDVPWPTLPAVTLLFGLTTVVTVALRRMSLVLAVVGAALTLSALTASAHQDWTAIAALSLTTVAMAVVAISAPSRGARLAGWLAGAVAKVLLAFAIGDAAGFRLDITAYLVLAVAALLLGVTYTPIVRDSRPAVEAAAHSAALVALVMCEGSALPAAGVLAVWGVAVGLTALRSEPVLRAAIAGVAEAVAWCLLLGSRGVGTLEAYTLPIALIAVALGVMAARHLSSWIAYGPALAAALLPSLAAVLLTSGGEWRRLLLGIGATIVVVAGAVWRRQAPFVLGGGTLAVLALHELVLVWKLLETWIPLAVIGLLLVGLAITYERRRRDLARLRDAVTRMT